MDKIENEQKTYFLKQLEALGVDMTQYLLALDEEIIPEKEIVIGPATREISIEELNSKVTS